MTLVWAAAAMGLAGAVHCTAMCGPLAVAGCQGARNTGGYFLGRLVAYAFAGAVVGTAGASIASAASLVWLQRAALVGVAIAATWRGIALWRRTDVVPLRRRKPRARWWQHIVDAAPRRGLGLGLVTGVLPCGMLAAAWLLAAGTGSPLHGAAVMLAFGVTSAAGLVGALVSQPLARRLPRRVTAVLWIALAAWLAARPIMDAAMHGNHSADAPGDHASCH